MAELYDTPEYREWRRMIRACYHPRDPQYKRVGANGIRVHQRWRYRFAHFLRDMGPMPKGGQLLRLDEHKDFVPSNCVWRVKRG